MNLEKNGDSFYSDELVTKIFDKINSCNSVLGLRERVVRRASYVLGLIPNWHPFSDLNRHSAYAAAVQFLRRNNLNLPIDTNEDEEVIFHLLDKTKKKLLDDDTVCTEIESYLSSKVMNYQRPFYY